jgi:uncharacterized protein YicC (UPF0701 family)
MDRKSIINTADLDQKENIVKNDVISVVKEAFMMYTKMKEVEGKALSTEINAILARLSCELSEIRQLAPWKVSCITRDCSQGSLRSKSWTTQTRKESARGDDLCREGRYLKR